MLLHRTQTVDVENADHPAVSFEQSPLPQIVQDHVHCFPRQADEICEVALTELERDHGPAAVLNAVLFGKIDERAGDPGGGAFGGVVV